MVLDIAISTRLPDTWPPQVEPEPEVQARPRMQGLCANDLYQRYLRGEEDTPFERVFNRMLREVDAGADEPIVPWLALVGECAVIWGDEFGYSRTTRKSLFVEVSYCIDPENERYDTENDIIRSMILAQRDRGGIAKRGFPVLMDRPLLLGMRRSPRAEQCYDHLRIGGGIAVRSLRGLGAQVSPPPPSKRLQVG